MLHVSIEIVAGHFVHHFLLAVLSFLHRRSGPDIAISDTAISRLLCYAIVLLLSVFAHSMTVK